MARSRWVARTDRGGSGDELPAGAAGTEVGFAFIVGAASFRVGRVRGLIGARTALSYSEYSPSIRVVGTGLPRSAELDFRTPRNSTSAPLGTGLPRFLIPELDCCSIGER
jgi:hypothetical protein